MGTDPWAVDLAKTEEFNLLMVRAVKTCEEILTRVDKVLAGMPEAVQSSGLVPWADLKKQWTIHYNNLLRNLVNTTTAAVHAQDDYRWGNRQSVRSML